MSDKCTCGAALHLSKGVTISVDGIDVKTDARKEECRECGEDFVMGKDLQAAEQAAAIEVLTNMQIQVSGRAIRFGRGSLGLRQLDLAQMLGVRMETISRWEKQAQVDRAPRLLVAEVIRIYSTEPERLAV